MSKSANRSELAAFRPGDAATVSIDLTDELASEFARYSGDHDPLQLDEDFAGRTLIR